MPMAFITCELHVKAKKDDPHRTKQIRKIYGLISAIPSAMDLISSKPLQWLKLYKIKSIIL